MAFSFKPLWKMLIEKDLTKKAFMEMTGISKSTVEKMNKGEYVSMEIIDRICKYFHCEISDVVVFMEK